MLESPSRLFSQKRVPHRCHVVFVCLGASATSLGFCGLRETGLHAVSISAMHVVIPATVRWGENADTMLICLEEQKRCTG